MSVNEGRRPLASHCSSFEISSVSISMSVPMIKFYEWSTVCNKGCNRPTYRFCESIRHLNSFLGGDSELGVAVGISNSLLVAGVEAPVEGFPLTVAGETLSDSISLSACEKCKGDGERAAPDLSTELSLVLLLLTAASIDGHWSDCTCASSVKYGLGRGASGIRLRG